MSRFAKWSRFKRTSVYSPRNTPSGRHRLLHIVPSDFNDRERWFKYLDHLKTYPSDQDGVSGHDRIVRARQENLEGDLPLPMYVQTHLASGDDRVTVTRGRPIPHEMQDYLVISTPTMPTAALDRPSRLAERVRRIAESVST